MECERCRRRDGVEYSFWCLKTAELGATGGPTPPLVPLEAFSATICDACIEAKRFRVQRMHRLIFFGLAPLIFIIGVAVLAFSLPTLAPTDRRDWTSALFLSGIAVGLPLFVFWLGIRRPSLQYINLGKQVAVEVHQAHLKARGYQGFWWTPPKRLSVR